MCAHALQGETETGTTASGWTASGSLGLAAAGKDGDGSSLLALAPLLLASKSDPLVSSLPRVRAASGQ